MVAVVSSREFVVGILLDTASLVALNTMQSSLFRSRCTDRNKFTIVLLRIIRHHRIPTCPVNLFLMKVGRYLLLCNKQLIPGGA